MQKLSLNGVEVYPFASENQLIEYIDKFKGILVAVNAEKIIHATDQTRSIINSNVGYCDGLGAVVAMKRKGFKDAQRIPGCELWLKIIERFHKERTFYLIGATDDVINNTVNKLKTDFPGIKIVGYHNGYLTTPELHKSVIDDVVDKRPDVVFVAMGSPKQEFLMEEIQKRHNAIFQGLGGSFDVYTNRVKRAPQWWLDHNLEFAYRLIRQPKRIKRHIHLLKFIWWIIIKKI